MVRDAAALGERELGGADVHAAVELHGVGVDDLAAEALGQVEGEVGLAGRGRPDDARRSDGAGGAVRLGSPTEVVPSSWSCSADELVGVLVASCSSCPNGSGSTPGCQA